ncbi:MAG: cytochrome c [Arenicellales bacterium]
MNTRLRLCGLAASLFITPAWGIDIDPDRERYLTNLVIHDCGSCHGTRLKGGLGPPLTTHALEKYTEEWIELVILDGQSGTAMPPWRDLLSPNDAAWLAKALKYGEIE